MRGLLARLLPALLTVGATVAVLLLVLGVSGVLPQETHAASRPRTTLVPSTSASPGPSLPQPTAGSVIPSAVVTPGPAGSAPVMSTIPVIVLNSTTVSGLATEVSDYVAALGWQVGTPGNFLSPLESTTVYFPAGQEAAASQLALIAPGDGDLTALVVPEVAPDALTLVLGRDAATWTPPALPRNSTTPPPTLPSTPPAVPPSTPPVVPPSSEPSTG